jgi:hypothetical protein
LALDRQAKSQEEVAMNALLIVLAVVSADPAFAARVKRYAEGYRNDAAPTSRVDRLQGLACPCAFLIHPQTEKAPPAVKQPLAPWARSQNWRGRLVVMDFYDGFDGSEAAKQFIDQEFPKIQGGQSMNLRAVRIDTTVIWGDGDAIERARDGRH